VEIDARATPDAGVFNGHLQFDLVVESDLPSRWARRELIRKFGECICWLTGLHADEIKELSAYMGKTLTSEPDMKMPAGGPAMLDKLTESYWRRICAKCKEIAGKRSDPQSARSEAEARPPMEDFEAIHLTGFDRYCIGSTGERFCYHGFALSKKGESTPLMVYAGSAEAPVTFTCVGHFPAPSSSSE